MTEKELNQLNKTLTFMQTIENRMVDDLKGILQGDFGLYDSSLENKIEFLDFEINVDGYSVNLYPSDKDLTQLGFKETLPEYPDGFIRENDLGLDLSDYDFDNNSDLQKMDEYYTKLEFEFINWFCKCWNKAGGKETIYQFYIASHDSNKSFDLKTERWINNNER